VSIYAKVLNGELVQFPYTIDSLCAENPYTNFGPNPNLLEIFPQTEAAIKSGEELVEIIMRAEPTVIFTHKSVQLPPSIIDGVWTVSWEIIMKTGDELASDTESKKQNVRDDRNNRLAACDWTQLSDAPGDKMAWVSYRQALRDVPLQEGFPWAITWPEEP
jgi:hypothetical protein